MKIKNPFVAFDRYCIRVPSLPITCLETLWESKNIEKSLKKIVKEPFVREAIYLAATELFYQIER